MTENIRPGDIMVTRNLGEDNNPTPGYWNHSALFIGEDDKVLEAQEKPGKIILSNYLEFWGRYPQIVVLRYVGSDINIYNFVTEARKYVGVQYWKLASVFRWLRQSSRGENCVSVLRRSFTKAMNYDPKWKVPDHIYKDRGWKEIYRK